MELKKQRASDSKGTKNIQQAADGTYTLRTTEIDENGDEVEVIKTIVPYDGAGS